MNIQSLNGAWEVFEKGSTKKIPASVPGCIHTDLKKSGLIPDPFKGLNERSVRWVGERDWVYTRKFTVSKKLLTFPRIVLRCEGLDTLAAVSINGKNVGSADNMYRTWEFDIAGVLKAGENTISILFKSVIPYTAKKFKENPLFTWANINPLNCRYYAYVRKPGYQFGWDWSPALLSCGIWKNISIIGIESRFSDIRITQEHGSRKSVNVDIACSIESTRTGTHSVSCSISRKSTRVADEIIQLEKSTGRCSVRIADPRLWWPVNMGKQDLYTVELKLLDENNRELDAAVRRIGLRTVELIQEKDEWGTSFYFKVNGKPMYVKGANWVPEDSFPHRTTRKKIHHLIKEAAAQHLNMLRVWGGGLYESEDFYDACDENGVLVWQDFMFACSAYPAYDPEFMDNVKQEAIDNITRIRHRASLALWCGNNEMEEAFAGSFRDGIMSIEEYDSLFAELLPGLVKTYDGYTGYHRASGSTPGKRRDRDHAFRTDAGDVHAWWILGGHAEAVSLMDEKKWVNMELEELQQAKWEIVYHFKPNDPHSQRKFKPRFVSEYGISSFPVMKTVRRFAEKKDLHPLSEVMNCHQRGTNKNLLDQMAVDFEIPRKFEHMATLSQIVQGEKLRWFVENWRASMPQNMGFMHWCINDCWPAVEWSTVDYCLNRKASYYIFKRFYQPLMVCGIENRSANTCDIFLINDSMKKVTGTLKWSISDTSGRILRKGRVQAEAGSGISRNVCTVDLADLKEPFEPVRYILWLEYMSKGNPRVDNIVMFEKPKYYNFEKPRLLTQVKASGKNTFRIAVKSDKPSFWTHVEVPGIDPDFSDNFFHLNAGKSTYIKAVCNRDVSITEFRKRLNVKQVLDLD